MVQITRSSKMRVRKIASRERFAVVTEPAPCMRCEGSGKHAQATGKHQPGCGCFACRPCPRCEGSGVDPEELQYVRRPVG